MHCGTALITGGSSGIGLEYSREFASRGYDLALVSNRAEDLEAVQESLQKEFGCAVHILDADLSEAGCAEKILAWCDSLGLQIEVLVNNAGMFFMDYLGPENLGKAETMLGLHVCTPTDLCVLFGTQALPSQDWDHPQSPMACAPRSQGALPWPPYRQPGNNQRISAGTGCPSPCPHDRPPGLKVD